MHLAFHPAPSTLLFSPYTAPLTVHPAPQVFTGFVIKGAIGVLGELYSAAAGLVKDDWTLLTERKMMGGKLLKHWLRVRATGAKAKPLPAQAAVPEAPWRERVRRGIAEDGQKILGLEDLWKIGEDKAVGRGLAMARVGQEVQIAINIVGVTMQVRLCIVFAPYLPLN